MSDIYDRLKDVIIVCPEEVYNILKEYLDGVFPGRPVILYQVNKFHEIYLEDNKHYLSLYFVPYIYGEPLKFIPGSWRYSIPESEIISEDLSGKGSGRLNIDPSVHRNPYLMPIFPSNCKVSFLNTEHLTQKTTLEYINRKLSDKIDVYDYSLANIRIRGKGLHIPYRITAAETEKLRRFLAVQKKYDVCIVGNCSERRKHIINELLKCGVNILTLGEISNCTRMNNISAVFGDERDRLIGQAKILLNVHLHPGWTVYESIRCDRWAAAGMPIISEISLAPGAPPDVVECPYDEIVATVKRELAKGNNIYM
jgi:hypothetical protein